MTIALVPMTQSAAGAAHRSSGSVPAPEASPQQAVLGDALSGFLASGGGYDTATAYLQQNSGTSAFDAGGCLAALKAYHAALDQQKALQLALDAWQTSYKAMSQNENALIGLIGSRTALLAAQIAAFQGATKVLEGAQGIVPSTVLSTVNYLSNDVGIIASAKFDGSPEDGYDRTLNALSLALGSYGSAIGAIDKSGVKSKNIAVANALAVIAAAGKAIYDAYGDIEKYLATADNTERSYLQAGAHYNDNLKAMKSSVAAMTAAMKDCPPAKKDCGGAHNGKHVGTHAACKAATATSK
jgi:tetratricopeptide (TPR) repeat protein